MEMQFDTFSIVPKCFQWALDHRLEKQEKFYLTPFMRCTQNYLLESLLDETVCLNFYSPLTPYLTDLVFALCLRMGCADC